MAANQVFKCTKCGMLAPAHWSSFGDTLSESAVCQACFSRHSKPIFLLTARVLSILFLAISLWFFYLKFIKT